jgi:choice-of-anchor B domain-containing protein
MKVSRVLARTLLLATLCLLLALAWGNYTTPGLAAQGAPGKTEDSLVARQMAAFAADRQPVPDLQPMGFTPCVGGFAGPYACENIDLMAFVPISAIGNGGNTNDIWGWTDPLDGAEYAIVGRDTGTAFVDISDPANPIYIGNLPAHGSASLWRGLKVYQDHVFIGSEAFNHGMQVFDLTELRDVVTPPVTFAETDHYAGFGSSHTIAVNENTGFAYAAGSNTCAGGLHMVNIQNPLDPTNAGCFSADGYSHETQCVTYNGPDAAHVGKEICMNNNEDTLTIVDVTNKAAPIQLSRTGYTGAGYTHQGWLTEDHTYYLLNDEFDETNNGHNTRTYIWDVSDLDDPFVLDYHDGPTPAIDHNEYVRGNYLYQSNYTAGVYILDLTDVANGNLSQEAFFDLYPANNIPSYSGTWSNYPYFASGIVVATSIDEGFFILQPHLPGVAELAIHKAQPQGVLTPGELITYTITLTNTGSITATGIVVTDTLNGNPTTVPGPTTLNPGQSAEYLFTYPIQPADCATGLDNLASATSAEDASAATLLPVHSDVECPVLAIAKSQPTGALSPGHWITYTITVTNSGSVPATGVVVTDTLNGNPITLPGPTTIAASASAEYEFAYQLQAADCQTELSNTATVASAQAIVASLPAPIVTTCLPTYIIYLPLIVNH